MPEHDPKSKPDDSFPARVKRATRRVGDVVLAKCQEWVNGLSRFFRWLRRYTTVLYYNRVPGLAAVILVVAMAVPDQSRDIFRGMLEDLTTGPWGKYVFRACLLHVTTLAGALALWFWSRQTLRLLVKRRRDWVVGHVPRITAVLPIAAMAFVLALVPTNQSVAPSRIVLAGSFALEGAALYFLLYVRRQSDSRLLAWSNQEKAYWWMGAFGCGLAVVVFVASLFLREYSFQFGPIGVLWCGCAFWVTLLSLLVIHGTRHRIPWIVMAGVLAVIFGAFNLTDNHVIRHERADDPTGCLEPFAETSVVEGFKAWKQSRPADSPIIFVAAEGGGIYAAYHAAYVLSCLQEDTNHAFGKQVFMISSVSGGSLGSGVFASLMAAQQRLGERRKINFVKASLGMFEDDLLSPVLAAGAGPDALQAFIPVKIPFFDRARALEDTLALRWRETEKSWAFSANDPRIDWSPQGSFWDLWLGPDQRISTDLPALFLNTTVVETGSRAVFSPYGMPGGKKPIPNIYHLWAGTKGLRVPIPAALVLSARFPVVTPVGRIDDITLRTCGPDERKLPYANWRFGDGGYFENSGLDTVLDVLRVLEDAGELPKERVRILVIHSFDVTTRDPPNGEGLSEFLSPVRALLRTRSDRAILARIRTAAEGMAFEATDQKRHYANSVLSTRGTWRAEQRVGGPEGMPEEQKPEDVDIPLGWMLSASSKKSIRDQVDKRREIIGQILGPEGFSVKAVRKDRQ